MRIKRLIVSLTAVFIVAIGLISIPIETSATMVNLTVSNEDLGISGIFGTVTWDVNDAGDQVDFTVNANESLLNGLDQDGNIIDSWGIDKFFFNTDLDTDIFIFVDLPTGWTIDFGKSADGFGKFTIETDGTGVSRQSSFTFSITGLTNAVDDDFYVLSGDPAGNGYGHFAMHVGGFDPALNEQSSAFFRDGPASVPDTSIMWLLGPAFIMLGIFGRKKAKEYL